MSVCQSRDNEDRLVEAMIQMFRAATSLLMAMARKTEGVK